MRWRPLPGDDHTPPTPVGDSVARVLRHLGAPTAGALESVFGQWPTLVGERIAAHAEPVGINEGTLTVRVSDPAWANQLRWLERDLITQLEATLGAGVVRSIEVRTGAARPATSLRTTRGSRRPRTR